MGTVIKADWDFDTSGLLEKCGLEEGGIVQKTIDKSVIDWSLQYVPHSDGAPMPLRKSAAGRSFIRVRMRDTSITVRFTVRTFLSLRIIRESRQGSFRRRVKRNIRPVASCNTAKT